MNVLLYRAQEYPCEKAQPICCLLKGQQKCFVTLVMMNEIRGKRSEPVRVVPVARYDTLHAQRVACRSGSSDPMALALYGILLFPQPLLLELIRYIYQGST